jgi:hypothetical protein
MRLAFKRVLLGIVGLAGLAVFAFVALFLYAMMPPLRSFTRAHEKLPAISVENGDTAYCRMRYCDFRFPLPSDVRVVRTNIEGGGFDTIYGTIYVVGTNGRPVNMRAYAELLQKKHFDLGIADASGCVGTDVPDVPFVNAERVIHYPVLSDFLAGSTDPVGGCLEIGITDDVVQIRFSYFGDY